MNTGGLFGERGGWSLPGFPDGSWQTVTLPAPRRDARRGLVPNDVRAATCRKGQDTSLGLKIADDPSRHYRALIYVNGWLIGRYVNDTGPQHYFPVPNGILRPERLNTIAIAVWNQATDRRARDRQPRRVRAPGEQPARADVFSPGYEPRTYAVRAGGGDLVARRARHDPARGQWHRSPPRSRIQPRPRPPMASNVGLRVLRTDGR